MIQSNGKSNKMKLCVKLLWISAFLNGAFSLRISNIKHMIQSNGKSNKMKLCVKLFWISVFLNGAFSLHISNIKHTRNNHPGRCNLLVKGNTAVIVDKDGDDRMLICMRRNGKYSWRDMKNFLVVETLGDHFNPGEDCSDIVRKNRDAKSGFFWVRPFGTKQATKVWCDVTTDGGGFMLVGYMGSPVSWTLPSNDSLVSPQGPTHWSSAFGNVSMLEFRIQVSTTNNLKASEADWLYRFKTPRRLTKLLISDDGGCTKNYPGVGHIEHVKDLHTGTITTETFSCSQFGHSYRSDLGWKRMNKCLGKACTGFAVFPGTKIQYDNFGGFSYSTNEKRSGIIHNSTAFVGCEHGKCCACFGPKGAKGDFCFPRCNKMNGGTVTTKAQVWFWIRSSVPKQPTWEKCMEYEVLTTDGNTETHFIDENSGISQKGSCSKDGVPDFVDGVVKVANKAAMDNLPPVQGLMSYRKDNAKLYVTDGQGWEALGKEKQEKALEKKLNVDERKILDISAEFRKANTELKNRLQILEERLKNKIYGTKGQSCKEILLNRPGATSGVYWIDPLRATESSHTEVKVYCDMETHGGGWTLVYSYTFTNYNNFNSSSNAVTPRPNWTASGANVPISTSPPMDESSRGAVDFKLWKEIGWEFLIKSNINDWIVCLPNGGSLVTYKNGPINCRNIKNVATKCQGISPKKINWHQYGPYLTAVGIFYDFVQTTSNDWPKHDPCGASKGNEKRGVPHPGGAIFLR